MKIPILISLIVVLGFCRASIAESDCGITCTFIARYRLPPKVEPQNVKILKANVSPDVGTYKEFSVIGSGRGRLFADCDGPKIYRGLAATAARHGADTVAYQQFGSLVLVRFLASGPDRGTVTDRFSGHLVGPGK